jgi:hypothetical protein
LDVHRDNVVACILKGTNEQKPERIIKTFSALPDGLKKLRTWLEEENCRHAAMGEYRRLLAAGLQRVRRSFRRNYDCPGGQRQAHEKRTWQKRPT